MYRCTFICTMFSICTSIQKVWRWIPFPHGLPAYPCDDMDLVIPEVWDGVIAPPSPRLETENLSRDQLTLVACYPAT